MFIISSVILSPFFPAFLPFTFCIFPSFLLLLMYLSCSPGQAEQHASCSRIFSLILCVGTDTAHYYSTCSLFSCLSKQQLSSPSCKGQRSAPEHQAFFFRKCSSRGLHDDMLQQSQTNPRYEPELVLIAGGSIECAHACNPLTVMHLLLSRHHS